MPELDPARPTAGLPRALGEPLARLSTRVREDDFTVEESLGFALDGEGGHLWLYVEKRGWNTDAAARRLARAAGIPARDVGFSGMKDRWSVSRQWFSIPVPAAGSDAAVQEFECDSLRVLQQARHGRKLRRGSHRANRFRVRLRGEAPSRDALEGRMRTIARLGVPNYFEAQRFGRRGDNVIAARAMLAGQRVDRRRRSLYLSAARAFLFNAVLAARVEDGSWQRILPGEAVNLDGSRSIFVADDPASLRERLARHDIHPSAPLWGRGDALARDQALALERRAVAPFQDLTEGLERFGIDRARRALRLPVRDLVWRRQDAWLELEFTLPRGAFATAVMREVVEARDARRNEPAHAQVRNST